MHADDPMNNSVDDWISILEGVDQDTLDVLGHIPASPASIGHVELLKNWGVKLARVKSVSYSAIH